MLKNNKLDYYIFLEELNKKVIENIIRLIRRKLIINIILTFNENFLDIVKFAKISKIPFFVIDNIKLAINYGAKGIFITSKNKNILINNNRSLKLEIIGSAHNQIEYYFKKRQNCSTVFLSPIFFNPKYTINQILNIQRFNVVSLNWKTKICALGGINTNNIKKIKCTKAQSLAFNRAIKNPPTI
jgi:thiamine monophosphate synthase